MRRSGKHLSGNNGNPKLLPARVKCSELCMFCLFVLIYVFVLKSSMYATSLNDVCGPQIAAWERRPFHSSWTSSWNRAQVRMIHGLQMIHGLHGRNWNGRKNNKTKRRLAIQDILIGIRHISFYCVLQGQWWAKWAFPDFYLTMFHGKLVQLKQLVLRCCANSK